MEKNSYQENGADGFFQSLLRFKEETGFVRQQAEKLKGLMAEGGRRLESGRLLETAFFSEIKEKLEEMAESQEELVREYRELFKEEMPEVLAEVAVIAEEACQREQAVQKYRKAYGYLSAIRCLDKAQQSLLDREVEDMALLLSKGAESDKLEKYYQLAEALKDRDILGRTKAIIKLNGCFPIEILSIITAGLDSLQGESGTEEKEAAGTEPEKAENKEKEAAEAEPEKAEAEPEKAEAEPEKTEKAEAEPEKAEAEPEKTEKAEAEPEKTEIAGEEPEKTEAAGGEAVKAGPENTEAAKKAKAVPVKAFPVRTLPVNRGMPEEEDEEENPVRDSILENIENARKAKAALMYEALAYETNVNTCRLEQKKGLERLSLERFVRDVSEGKNAPDELDLFLMSLGRHACLVNVTLAKTVGQKFRKREKDILTELNRLYEKGYFERLTVNGRNDTFALSRRGYNVFNYPTARKLLSTIPGDDFGYRDMRMPGEILARMAVLSAETAIRKEHRGEELFWLPGRGGSMLIGDMCAYENGERRYLLTLTAIFTENLADLQLYLDYVLNHMAARSGPVVAASLNGTAGRALARAIESRFKEGASPCPVGYFDTSKHRIVFLPGMTVQTPQRKKEPEETPETEASESGNLEPEATEAEALESGNIEPETTEAKASESRSAEPEAAEAKASESQSTETKATEAPDSKNTEENIKTNTETKETGTKETGIKEAGTEAVSPEMESARTQAAGEGFHEAGSVETKAIEAGGLDEKDWLDKEIRRETDENDWLALSALLTERGQEYCALSYLKAKEAEVPEAGLLYRQLAFALDDPAAALSYSSEALFEAYFAKDRPYAREWLLCAMLRCLYQDEVSFDYNIDSLLEMAGEQDIFNGYDKIKELVYVLAEFKKKNGFGMARYSSYAMPELSSWEEELSAVAQEAGILYEGYVENQKSMTHNHKRLEIVRKYLFSPASPMITCLKQTASAERDEKTLADMEQFLRASYFEEGDDIAAGGYKESRIREYIDRLWEEAGKEIKDLHKSEKLLEDSHRNLATKVRAVLDILCRWLTLCRKMDGTATATFREYQEKKPKVGELLQGAEEALKESLLSGGQGFEDAWRIILLRTLKDICSKMDGSFSDEARRYGYIGFLADGYVLLDGRGCPDLDDRDEPDNFRPSVRVLLHAFNRREGEKLDDELWNRLQDMGEDDLGSVRALIAYFEEKGPDKDKSRDPGEARALLPRAESAAMTGAEADKAAFSGWIELAMLYGQVSGAESDYKDRLLSRVGFWLENAELTHNYGYFSRQLDALKAWIEEKARDANSFLLGKAHSLIKISEQKYRMLSAPADVHIGKFKKAFENGNYTASQDLLGELEDFLDSEDETIWAKSAFRERPEGEDILLDFLEEYEQLYRMTADKTRPLSSQLDISRIARHAKNAKALSSAWPQGGSAGSEKIRNLLDGLGLLPLKVHEKGRGGFGDGFEAEFGTAAEGGPSLPAAVAGYVMPFEELLREKGLRILCTAGMDDVMEMIRAFRESGMDKPMLLLTDVSLPKAARKLMARKVRREAFPFPLLVLDRVAFGYILTHMGKADGGTIVKEVLLPFSYYQPFRTDGGHAGGCRPAGEAFDLITVPLTTLGLRFGAGAEELLRSLACQANYYPDILAFYGKRLLETMTETFYAGYDEAATPPFNIGEEHVMKALSDDGFRAEARARMKQRLGFLKKDKAYLIALLVAELGFTREGKKGWRAEEILEEAASFDITALKPEEVGDVLAAMTDAGILKLKDLERYDFMRESVRLLLGSRDEVENALLGYML